MNNSLKRKAIDKVDTNIKEIKKIKINSVSREKELLEKLFFDYPNRDEKDRFVSFLKQFIAKKYECDSIPVEWAALTVLDLNFCSLIPEDCASLARLLGLMNQLEVLILGSYSLKKYIVLKSLVGSLHLECIERKKFVSKLESQRNAFWYDLETRFNRLGSVGVEQICSALRGMKKLSYLDLSDIGMMNSGMILLCAVIPHLTRLTVLELGGNEIGVAGVNALADVLPSCSSLTL